MSDNTPMIMIEEATQLRAAARRLLGDRIKALESKLEVVKSRAQHGIKSAAAAYLAQHNALKDIIDDNRDQFKKPRSRILHETKVGLQKAKGKTVCADKDKTVKLIKKHFADQKDQLITTVETPNIKALEKLSAANLKRVGITIENSTDVIVIKDIDTAIDKLVKALLKEKEDDTAEEKVA
jgi:hypothetical protein